MHRFILTLGLISFGCAPAEETPLADADTAVEAPDAAAPDMTAADTAPPDLGPTDDMSAPAASVFERGPYNVGHRRWDITYDAELEAGRTIKLSVWYPTHDTEGRPGLYIVNTQRDEVLRDASVAIDGQAPLLVFSHGNGSLAEQSYFMTEFFASHGWVVVAPYHTGNTVLDVANGGGGLSLEAAPMRPQDISAALDEMYGLPASDPLSGKISDDVVLSGHSFGGFTTLAVAGGEFAVDEVEEQCAQPNAPAECEMVAAPGVTDLFRAGFLDSRVDVAIPQAPGGFFAFLDGLSAIEIPTLLLTAAQDRTLPARNEADPIWAAMAGPHVRVDVTRAGHFTFSNMCELLPVAQVQDDGCGEGFIAPDIAFELVNAYSLAFARYVLWGDRTMLPLLRGEDDRYGAEVILSQKPGAL